MSSVGHGRVRCARVFDKPAEHVLRAARAQVEDSGERSGRIRTRLRIVDEENSLVEVMKVGTNRACPQYLPIGHYKYCAIVGVPLKLEVIIDEKVA